MREVRGEGPVIPWKNAGMRWYRRKWESAVGNIHLRAWTHKGIVKRTDKLESQLRNKRVGR